jgi:probable rRNA maturation factor
MTRKTPPESKPTESFTLDITAAAGRPFAAYLRRHLRAAHAVLRPPLAELSLALVGDARMSALHAQFLGIPGPTDVLTFPLDVDRRGRATSGEVVVCVPEARRRARQAGGRVERELLLYALHGLLHLCGYDDRTASGFRKMHRTEDMILTELGVGPVFHPQSPSAPRRAPTTAAPAAAAAPRRRAGTRAGAGR